MSDPKSPCPYQLERADSIRVHEDAVNRLENFTMPPLQLGNPDCVRYANRLDGPNVPVTVSEALSKGKRKRKRRRKSKKRKTRKRKRKRKNKGKKRKTKKR